MSGMRRDEVGLRRRLVSLAKRAAELGLMPGTWGNASARLDGDRLLITPSGLEKDMLRPSDLVLVDMNGVKIKGTRKPSTEMPMHLAIYKARDDVGAVFHTHSTFATVLSVSGMGIPALTVEFGMVVGEDVPLIDYAEPGTVELAESVTKALGKDKMAAILRNHGAVAVGSTPEDALLVAMLVEMEARTYYLARLLGEPRGLPEDELRRLREKYYAYGRGGHGI